MEKEEGKTISDINRVPTTGLTVLLHEVERKLGSCLLLLQQYELLLKETVAKRKLSGMLEAGTDIVDKAVSSSANKTMGQLVGELTGKYFQPTLTAESPVRAEGPQEHENPTVGWVLFTSAVSLPPDAHEQLTAELAELVSVRNDLVHHFLETQELANESGLLAADAYLEECRDLVRRHLHTLRKWATSMNQAKEKMIAFVNSSQFSEFIQGELSEGSSVRREALPHLTGLLREAAAACQVDGWAPISAAIKFIASKAPDVTLKKTCFASWPQVLHEAKVFEFRKERFADNAKAEIWFRVRP